jgi:hypothetical protein
MSGLPPLDDRQQLDDTVEGSKPPEPRDPPIRATSHRIRWVVLCCVVAFIIVVAVEAMTLLGARQGLQNGRSALQAARREALAGDLGKARASLDQASASFGTADDRLHGPIGTMARLVPWAGNSADAAAAMADAGRSLSAAGITLVDAFHTLPDGIGSLAPQGGVVPLSRYAALAGPVATAGRQAASAEATLAAAPDSFMPSVIARARWDAEAETGRLATDLDGLGAILQGAPAFGGAHGPERYLVVAQNPAELRGTGGLWGAYAIMTLDHGHVHVSRSRPRDALKSFPAGRVPDPSTDYARNYDGYGGAGSWKNMNMTPDMPSAARAALANYALGEHTHLDGVFAVDPFALRSFLEVTGPIHSPGAGEITAQNVVDVTTNRAYSDFPNSNQRKDVLGTVGSAVFARFLQMDGQEVARLRLISNAVADGHLRIYSTNPTTEGGLATLGIDGAVTEPAGDVMGVIVNNASGNKVDYYATRQVNYDVQLGGTSEAIGTTTVTIANDAPTSGEPRYVIGPNPNAPGAKAGDQIPITSVWCHTPCTLASATRDGKAIRVATGSENGVPWLQDYRTIPAGSTGTLSVVWRSSDVWSGNSSGGSYQLTLLGQTTIQPTDVSVTIHAPSGTHIVWTSTPMAVEGGTATWRGSPSSALTLGVRFQAPLPLRWFRDVSRSISG